METNDSDMSFSEWDIVGSSSLEGEEFPVKDDSEDVTVINSSEDTTRENLPTGSAVEDVLEELEPPQSDSSGSSSDIDVIEESFFDDNHTEATNSNTPRSMGLLISCSYGATDGNLRRSFAERVHRRHPVADTVAQQPDSPRRNLLVKDYLIIVSIACLLGVYMHTPETPVDTVKEMEKRILILQEENRELKSHVISKIEEDKPFVVLEEQIEALKGENSKLSHFMQDLIHQLEEKTIIFKKESEIKGTYQNEIDKLKEQVNILQIDNDELQNELVRMRYSVYSPPAQDPKSTQKRETSNDKSGDQNENSTEILSEEIKELQRKLYSEVEKLKNWKDSVQHLMKELENRPKEFDKKQEHGSKKHTDKDNKFSSKKTNKGNPDEEDPDNERFSRIPELNITDLVFRYIGVDKKKVKGVFESVSHYFKKAQEKTKDIFDESMKNDMWNFIGGLRKQWHMMKKAYFPKHHKRAQSPDADDTKPSSNERYHEKSERSYRKDSKIRMQQEAPTKRHGHQHYDTKDEFKKEQNAEKNSKWESYKQNLENLAETTISLNSWLFDRAAHRSELRDQEEDVNWFLKNRKEADVPGSDNLQQQEEEMDDPYDNIDFFAMD